MPYHVSIDKYLRFHGRPKSTCRFKIGDIVEQDGMVGVVSCLPPTPDECWRRVNRLKEIVQTRAGVELSTLAWSLDSSDDCYTVLFDKDDLHSHPEASSLMPLQIPLSEEQILRVNELVKYVKT